MKNFKLRVGGLSLRASSATRNHIEAWFFEQKKVPQTCGSRDQWANEYSTKYYEAIRRYYGEVDSIMVGWAENGDLLLVASSETNCEAFCAIVPLHLVPPACDYCQMQAAMDKINVIEIGYA